MSWIHGLLDHQSRRQSPLHRFSAGFKLAAALAAVQETLSRRWLLREIELPAARAFSLMSWVRQSSQVLSQKAVQDRIRMRLRLTQENWERLQKKLASTKRNS